MASMLLRISVFLFVGMMTNLAWSENALADFRVCNATKNLVGISVGYRNGDEWLTEGWFRVPADSCASVLKG